MILNSDILIRLRYALDIKDTEIIKIFKLGGIQISGEEVKSLFNKDTYKLDDESLKTEEKQIISHSMLDSFLNGFIIYRRGAHEFNPEQERPTPTAENINNFLLKKLKIALQLTSEDMLSIFELAGISVTKGELSAVLRKAGQRNYKECGDRYARNFLKGLTVKYRQ